MTTTTFWSYRIISVECLCDDIDWEDDPVGSQRFYVNAVLDNQFTTASHFLCSLSCEAAKAGALHAIDVIKIGKHLAPDWQPLDDGFRWISEDDDVFVSVFPMKLAPGDVDPSVEPI